jgi:hypothetical protein
MHQSMQRLGLSPRFEKSMPLYIVATMFISLGVSLYYLSSHCHDHLHHLAPG